MQNGKEIFKGRSGMWSWKSKFVFFKIFFSLLSEPETEIIGGPEVFIENGSTINLTCVVRFSPEPPAYIFWNHNEAVGVEINVTLRIAYFRI